MQNIPTAQAKQIPPRCISLAVRQHKQPEAKTTGINDVQSASCASTKGLDNSENSPSHPNGAAIVSPQVQPPMVSDSPQKAETPDASTSVQLVLSKLDSISETVQGLLANTAVSALPPTSQQVDKAEWPNAQASEIEATYIALANKRWLTVKEAALLFPLSERALRHLINKCLNYLKFPADANARNIDLSFARCIVRPGDTRSIYLDQHELHAWFSSGAIGVEK